MRHGAWLRICDSSFRGLSSTMTFCLGEGADGLESGPYPIATSHKDEAGEGKSGEGE